MATRSSSTGCFRDISVPSLTGHMDGRSLNGHVGFSNWRICLNVASTEPNQVCRMGGWRRYGADAEAGFWNQDLHDQLLCNSSYYLYDDVAGDCYDDLQTRPGCKEPISMLFSFETEESRKLIAATESRIYEQNEGLGNWRIIADGLGSKADDEVEPCAEKVQCGCGGSRFSAAQLGGWVIFTNGIDPVLAYRAGDTESGCDLVSAFAIPDLVGLGVTRAKTVASWKGFVFLGGVYDDAGDHPYRIMWSDFNTIEFDPAPADTEAGFQDVSLSEVILAIVPLGEFCYLFTDEAIYQIILVELAQGRFRFREVYRGSDGLAFRYAYVVTGEAIIYAAETSLFQLTPENPRPQIVDWVDFAAGYIYLGLDATTLGGFTHLSPFGPVNKEACDEFVGWFDPIGKTAFFSWATDSNVCPNVTLRLDLKQSFSSLVNKGFTSGISFKPDSRITMAEFLNQWQICPLDNWPNAVKEGDPQPSALVPFESPPLWLVNSSENPDLPIDPDSVCARWGNLTMKTLCEGCDSEAVLVLADADDFTLKQYEPGTYYRELYSPDESCVGAAFSLTTADGSVYCAYGYSSLMQSDLDKLGIDTEKLINKAVVDFEAELQTTPNKLAFQIAVSGQPKCSTWNSLDSQDIKCFSDDSVEEHAVDNTRPAGNAKYPAFLRGRYVGWRFYVEAPDEVSTITGGGVCFNALTISIRNTQTQAAW